MSRNGRPIRPKRKRFFVAGEGASEVAFFAAMQAWADGKDLAVHLVSEDLKGGSAIKMAERAVDAAKRNDARRGAHYGRWAFLDTDTMTAHDHRNVVRVLGSANIQLVPQNPCFEALLLRHFSGFEHANPTDCPAAQTQLAGPWPRYRKPPGSKDIRERIGFADAIRYARVEAGAYADFLRTIGLLH